MIFFNNLGFKQLFQKDNSRGKIMKKVAHYRGHSKSGLFGLTRLDSIIFKIVYKAIVRNLT